MNVFFGGEQCGIHRKASQRQPDRLFYQIADSLQQQLHE